MVTNQLSEKEICELADRWIKGTITEQEKVLLDDWYNQMPEQQLIWKGSDADHLKLKKRLFRNISERTISKPYSRPVRGNYKWMAAASAVLAVFLVFYLSADKENKKVQTQVSNPAIEKIVPGRNKAILTLSDGSVINLDDVENGLVTQQSGITVSKMTDGQLVYKINQTGATSETGMFNTISTPAGGQYQVILPDESKVWLNAESSLRFPVKFNTAERNVELKGEAYFEIAHNQKQPFKVISGDQTVEVLGTQFNIDSYPEESAIKTTLLKGRIKVSLRNNGKARILRPGQQSQAGNTINITSVNADESIAWKNGYFMFDNESIYSVMRKMARWYDVEISYEDGFTDQNFWGSIPRSSDLSDVLRKLELTKTVKFKIEGRGVLVMK